MTHWATFEAYDPADEADRYAGDEGHDESEPAHLSDAPEPDEPPHDESERRWAEERVYRLAIERTWAAAYGPFWAQGAIEAHEEAKRYLATLRG